MSNKLTKVEQGWIIAKETRKRNIDDFSKFTDNSIRNIEYQLKSKSTLERTAKRDFAELYCLANNYFSSLSGAIDSFINIVTEDEWLACDGGFLLRSASALNKIENEFKRVFGSTQNVHDYISNGKPKKIFGIFR